MHSLNIASHGQGETLSLLHGWGMNSAVFSPLIAALEAQYQLYAVDLPGHGASAAATVDFDQQVEQMGEFLPASTLVAWSMGGLYATRLATRFPDKFKRLILVACNPCFVQRPGWGCAVEADVFDEFAQALIADWQGTIKRFMGLQLKGAEQARDLIRQMTAMVNRGGAPDRRALRQGLDLLLQYDARADLAALSQPVMVVLGQRDTLVPISLEAQIRVLNPAIRVECVARSAHAPFVTHRELFADLIRGFTQSSSTG